MFYFPTNKKGLVNENFHKELLNKIEQKKADKEEVTLNFIKKLAIEHLEDSVNKDINVNQIKKAKTSDELGCLGQEIEFFGEWTGNENEKQIGLFLSSAAGERKRIKKDKVTICNICYRICLGKRACGTHTPKTNETEYRRGRRIKKRCEKSSRQSNPRIQLSDFNFKDWCKVNSPNVYKKIKGAKSLYHAIYKLNGKNEELHDEYEKMAGLKGGQEIEVFFDQIELKYLIAFNPNENQKEEFGRMGYRYFKINKYNIITQVYFLNAESWATAENSLNHGGQRTGSGRPKKKLP